MRGEKGPEQGGRNALVDVLESLLRMAPGVPAADTHFARFPEVRWINPVQ